MSVVLIGAVHLSVMPARASLIAPTNFDTLNLGTQVGQDLTPSPETTTPNMPDPRRRREDGSGVAIEGTVA